MKIFIWNFWGDSIYKKVTINSSFSEYFIFGNLILGFPFGHIFDLFSSGNKKYTYDDDIYVDLNNESDNYKLYSPSSMYKNKVNLLFTFPEGNHFYQEMQGEYGTQFGFLGLGTGLEYYYSEDQFFSLNFKYIMDFPVFIPAPVDYEAPYPIRSAWALSFTDNYDFNHWILGYGLHYTEYFYAYINMDKEFNNYTEFENYYGSIGPALSIKYKIRDRFRLGLNYNPSLFRVDSPARIDYSHVFFFELGVPVEL